MLACPQSRLGLGLDWTDFERRKSVKMLFDLPKKYSAPITYYYYVIYFLSKTFKDFLINKSLASLALLQILASLKISLANFINCSAEHVSYFSKTFLGKL